MHQFFHDLIHESDYRTIGYDIRSALPHHDNSVEIIQFWSDGGYFIVRNNIFPIIPGSIIIVNAMETHYSNPSKLSKYNRSKLIISTECFNQICSLCNFTALSDKLMQNGGIQVTFSPTHNNNTLIDSLFQEAYTNYLSKDTLSTAQANIIDCTIRIFSLVAHAPYTTVSDTAPEHILHRMTEYINSHLLTWEDVSLTNICSTLHISPSYASHLFKQLTNKSITQYVTDLRISEAKKLLLTTDLKVFDIAEMLKFKDSTTFCKTFKKSVGCTPRTYRVSDGTSGRNTSKLSINIE